MTWKVLPTQTFSREFKKYKKHNEFLQALDGKIKRLQEDPYNVGGFLTGRLHGFKATRLLKHFRILFRIDEDNQAVFLEAIDHRKHGYANF